MLAFFGFALLGALVSIYLPAWITVVWVPPLGLFAVSLLAAVSTNPRFRRDWSLLGLHLGLLAFIGLVAYSRLTYFDGAVTLTRGEEYGGRLQLDRRGPLHGDRVQHLRFINQGFVEEFPFGHRWPITQARVSGRDAQGREWIAEIDNDRPLIIDGYRIYSTFNRGFSPVLEWQANGREKELGSVQLRPGDGFNLATEWLLPDGPRLWALLEAPAVRPVEPGERRANLGAAELDHRLLLRIGEQRILLRQGEAVTLPEGSLRYVRLDSWMGYRVVYDVAMHWMVGAALVVVISMIAFYARLLARPKKTPAKRGLETS